MNFSKEFSQQYEVIKSLGQGGMGEVMLARDLRRGGMVAIKTVLATAFADDEARLRFLREARITSALSHPNIIRVIDQGTDAGKLFIAFEYVEGGGLGAYLREKGPLKPAKFFHIAVGILDAVAYAHRSGVLHRDLKTDNVLLDREMQPRVADFGLAKGIDNAGLETVSGTMMGTPIYMAPELARALPATGATDQYAIGVILYSMLCGKPPLIAENPLEMLEKHVREIPKLVTVHRPEVPDELAQAIHRALAKDPAERWPEVADLRDAVNSMVPTAAKGWTHTAMERGSTTKIKPHKSSQPVLIPIPDDEPPPVARTAQNRPDLVPPPVLIPIKDAYDPGASGTGKRRTGPSPVVIPSPEPTWKPSAPLPPDPPTIPPTPPAAAPRRLKWVGPLVALAILNLLVLAWRAHLATPRGGSVAELSAPVRGLLGLPLGQVMTISGQVVDGSTTGRKADEDLRLLNIQFVNGKALAQPITLPFSAPPWSAVKPPRAGAAFRLTGYESGAFTGLPADAAKVVPEIPATTSFAWTGRFEVLKDENAKPAK